MAAWRRMGAERLWVRSARKRTSIAVGTYGFYLIANCAAKLDDDGCPVSSATRCAQRVDMAIDMPWGNLAIRQKPGTD